MKHFGCNVSGVKLRDSIFPALYKMKDEEGSGGLAKGLQICQGMLSESVANLI